MFDCQVLRQDEVSRQVRAFRVRGDVVREVVPDLGSGSGALGFTWHHAGVPYQLFIVGQYLADPMPDPTVYEQLLPTVRYAQPSAGS
jgi:hypothetical protein